jgi:hypothetical protein
MYKDLNSIFSIYKDNSDILINYVKNESDFNGLIILTNYLIKNKRFYAENAINLSRELGKIKFSIWLQNPNLKLYKEIDYLGEFYKILGKYGDDSISSIDLFYNDQKVYELRARHEDVSGFSLIEEIANFLNCGDLFHSFKEKTSQNRLIEWIYLIYNFIMLFFYNRLKNYPWSNYSNKKINNKKVNYFKLSKDETKKLRKKSRENKVNFLIYSLYNINNVLKRELLTNDVDTEWIMPINKKPINLINKKYSKTYNDYSFLPLSIKRDASYKDLKNEINNSKRKKSWLRVFLEVYIMVKLSNIVNLYLKLRNERKSSFGSISYFGVSNTPFSEKDFFVGNTSPNYLCPITISCGVLNGELIIALNIKNELLKNKEHLIKILEKIKFELLD